MNSRRIFITIASTALLAFGVAACGEGGDSTGSSDLSGDIAGAGASSQDAAQQAWIAGFQTDNSSVSIAYDPVGSGGGREAFIAGGKTDYAGTDSPFADEELSGAEDRCKDAGGEFIQIPVYISPIAVVYNLPEVEDLQLSPDTLAGIFKQEITKWNDPAIAADNPDADLPSSDITPVNRSDDSGTTANFTDYLSQAAPDVWTYEPDDAWPVDGGEAAEGTSGVVEAVGAGQGTIGYADASQAGDLGVAALKIGDEFVAPSAEGATAAADAAKEVKDGDYVFSFEIDRTTDDPSQYPVILISSLAACTAYDDQATADIVKGYLSHVISSDGQQAAADNAGSAPISSELQGQIQPAVDAIGS